MYKQALDTLIKNNNLPKSLMLYGECNFFRSYYLEKIASIFGKKEEMLKFYFDEYDYKSAKNFISQSSLFGDKNILIIKSEKNIPKKELETLIGYCHNNKNSYFLFEFFGDDKRAKEIAKVFSKKFSADFVRFFKPYHNEAINILQNFAKEIALEIEIGALEHLYLLQNEELSLCFEELKKLKVLDKNITKLDIDRYSFSLGIGSQEKIIEDFFQKKDIKESIKEFLEISNTNEVFIINMIENYLTTLFMFYTYISAHGNFDPKAILGYPLPLYIAKKRAEQSIRIKLPTYKKFFEELSKAELKLKSNLFIDKTSYLISTLIKLQTFL